MARVDPLVKAIREKIAANDAALRPLMKERAFLDAQLRTVLGFYPEENGHTKRAKGQSKRASLRNYRAHFAPTPGGPSETLYDITRANPAGIARSWLLDEAMKQVKTTASDPRRTTEETLRQMLKKGMRIEMREDGKIYPTSRRLKAGPPPEE